MIERIGDLWTEAERERAAVVITTNGSTKKDGTAVMGRGCAKEAVDRFDGIDEALGAFLRHEGNHVTVLRDLALDGPPMVISFPVKHEWHQKAEIQLIERSARELVSICDSLSVRKAILPRPGCGAGMLRWEQVKPVLAPLLDDRFIVVSYES